MKVKLILIFMAIVIVMGVYLYGYIVLYGNYPSRKMYFEYNDMTIKNSIEDLARLAKIKNVSFVTDLDDAPVITLRAKGMAITDVLQFMTQNGNFEVQYDGDTLYVGNRLKGGSDITMLAKSYWHEKYSLVNKWIYTNCKIRLY